MCSIVPIGAGDQWGSGVLLMRLVAVGKKRFLWREVLVLMDRNLLPEGRDSKRFFSCRRKYILFWAFLVMELMFSSHLRSWVMVMPRTRNNSSVHWGVTQGDGGRWSWVLPEVYYHLHCLESVALQVVLTTLGDQMVNLPPVGRLIPTRDEPNEGGVVCKLQELDRLMTGGAGICVKGEE